MTDKGEGKGKRDSHISSGNKSPEKEGLPDAKYSVPADSNSGEEEGNQTTEDQSKKKRADNLNKTDESNIKSKDETTENGVSPKKQSKQNSAGNNSALIIGALIFLAIAVIFSRVSDSYSDSNSQKEDWRSNIDPNNRLVHEQQYTITASLKSIMDQTHREGVSTLLILSPKEKSAARIAQCLLKFVNRKSRATTASTEIDLKSHRGGKLQLDQDLQLLFKSGSDIQAVLLRHIDDNSSSDAFERARLLFAYCDGENPVVPHRLIIMTATSETPHESELRERFKEYWPSEHDFVDALMSRISGHTLFVDEDQLSIC
ncbi:unnamed protein product [Adineta ricciae]|uniref:Uncharacterized protein n=1 Tax=Adineta ricciae TaxID=249248 RepID=A0A813SPD3_ADIRI|nr:unnamed protein product [Adineta ricciae]CAF1083254.1 unnamed protein product [Adineta ricciae]